MVIEFQRILGIRFMEGEMFSSLIRLYALCGAILI